MEHCKYTKVIINAFKIEMFEWRELIKKYNKLVKFIID